MQGVALLHDGDYRVGLNIRVFLHGHGLMQSRVKWLTQRIHRFDVEFAKTVRKTLEGQIDAIVNRLHGLILVRRRGIQRPLQVVHNAQ